MISTPVTADDEAPNCGLYTYRAEVDGDTIVANIDLGFNTWLHNEHLRLLGIDTPERGQDGYREASEGLSGRIAGKRVYICTVKAKRSDKEARGSFGRYLAVIWHNGENVGVPSRKYVS